jgi:predicted GNAT family acetyltransferase
MTDIVNNRPLQLIRADGLKVVASCGFVVDYLQKHPEFRDLVG